MFRNIAGFEHIVEIGAFWLHFGIPRTSKNKVFVWKVVHFPKNRAQIAPGGLPGPPGAHSGPPGAHFAPPGGHLGPPGARFGAPLGLLGRASGELLGPPKAPGGFPGGPPHRSLIFEAFWEQFWLHLAPPGPQKTWFSCGRCCIFRKFAF